MNAELEKETNADGGKSLSNGLLVRAERVDAANKMIRTIADCGRRFFYYAEKDRYARIEMDNRGRIWWIDEYTSKRIYTHYKWEWSGFSHGGTLRSFAQRLQVYISTGQLLYPGIFGPWPDYLCNGDLWGYGDDMKQVRDTAHRLGIIEH